MDGPLASVFISAVNGWRPSVICPACWRGQVRWPCPGAIYQATPISTMHGPSLASACGLGANEGSLKSALGKRLQSHRPTAFLATPGQEAANALDYPNIPPPAGWVMPCGGGVTEIMPVVCMTVNK
jgi:hypothetical protein